MVKRAGKNELSSIVGDADKIAETSDVMRAAALSHQRGLLKLRSITKKKRLEQAKVDKLDKAPIQAKEHAYLASVQAYDSKARQFTLANIKKPIAQEKLAQVWGVVLDSAEQAPLTAALLDSAGMVVQETAVAKNGSFHFKQEKPLELVKVQISNAKQQVLFRDGDAYTVAVGQKLDRTVSLGEPIIKPAPAPSTMLMPNLEGRSEASACAILFRLGVTDISSKAVDNRAPKDIVIEHSPAFGKELLAETSVQLIVSTGQSSEQTEAVLMPKLVGLSKTQASARIKALKIPVTLNISTSERQTEEAVVLEQEPEVGKRLEANDEIKLLVSVRPKPTDNMLVVDDYVGKTTDAAVAQAEKIGFTVVHRKVAANKQIGKIVEQSLKAGSEVALPAELVLVSAIAFEKEVEVVEVVKVYLLGFRERLAEKMANDERFVSIGLSKKQLVSTLQRFGIENAADAKKILSRDNKSIQARFELKSLSSAVKLKAVLRVALKDKV